MTMDLVEDPSSMETLQPDVWVEVDRRGHYQDVSENEESEILRDLQGSPWRKVVEDRYRQSRPWLYKIITDADRSAFVKELPLKPGGRILDVGSGWGQVALPLAAVGEVSCLDQTKARIEILREIARQEGVMLKYVCGNFRTIPFSKRQFDAIIFNGSLEYMALGTEGVPIWDIHCSVLEKARSLLSERGIVYVGIENCLGLKYLLGAPDDHTNMSHLMHLDEAEAANKYGLSHEGASLRIKTWSLVEYHKLFLDAGMRIEAVYGCFPDYKLMRRMIPIQKVNEVLAIEGMVYPEHSGVDGSFLTQNDVLPSLYRRLAASGVAEHFCPSYGIIARAA